jgi:hypothetical protein
MKYYIYLLLIFVGVLAFDFYVIGALSHTAEDLTKNFEQIYKAINEENWQNAKAEFSQVEEKWNRHKKWWAMVIDHHEIDNIDTSFSRINEYLNHQNQALSAGELSVLKQFIKHIPETEKVCWKNIF